MANGDTKDLRKELNKQRKRIAYLEQRVEQLESLSIETDFQDWIDKNTVVVEPEEIEESPAQKLRKIFKDINR